MRRLPPPPILLRADATSASGTGHVMRALALGQQWRASGGQATLATRAMPAALARRLADEGVGVAWLPAPAAADAEATAALGRALRAPWLVADGYAFGETWQRDVRSAGLRLLAVDDDAQIGRYATDALLDQNLDASPERYGAVAPGARLLLGSRYVLLRREFLRCARREVRLPKTARRLLVTFGGSDPLGLTSRVLRVLAEHHLPPLDVRAIVGPAATPAPIGAAAEALAARGHTVRLAYPGVEMPALMAWADLAITAAGSTCWELAFLGVPAITVVVASNQAHIAERLASHGVSVSGGRALDVERCVPAALEGLLGDGAARARMACAGRATVDGLGPRRVAAALGARAA